MRDYLEPPPDSTLLQRIATTVGIPLFLVAVAVLAASIAWMTINAIIDLF